MNITPNETDALQSYIQRNIDRLTMAIAKNAHATYGDRAEGMLWNAWVAAAPASVKVQYEAFRAARSALALGQPVDKASIGL